MKQYNPNYSLLKGAMTPKESNNHSAEETEEQPKSFETMLREVSEMSGLQHGDHDDDDLESEGFEFGDDSWCSSSSEEIDIGDLRVHLREEHERRGFQDSRLPECWGQRSFSENMSSSSFDFEEDDEISPLSCKSGVTETTHTSSLASISILDSDSDLDGDRRAVPTTAGKRSCDKTVRFSCVRFCAEPPEVRYFEPVPLSDYSDLWYSCHQLQQMMDEYYFECVVKFEEELKSKERDEHSVEEREPLEF